MIENSVRKSRKCRAVLEAQRAVHIGFAGGQFGIEDEGAVELAIGQPHGHFRAGLTLENMRFAIGVDDGQLALANESFHHMR